MEGQHSGQTFHEPCKSHKLTKREYLCSDTWELANNGRAGTAGGQKLGQFYGKYYEIMNSIALIIFSASFWSNKIPISLF